MPAGGSTYTVPIGRGPHEVPETQRFMFPAFLGKEQTWRCNGSWPEQLWGAVTPRRSDPAISSKDSTQ